MQIFGVEQCFVKEEKMRDIYIEVTCDLCNKQLKFNLSPSSEHHVKLIPSNLAHYINKELLELGWNIDNDICDSCLKEKCQI